MSKIKRVQDTILKIFTFLKLTIKANLKITLFTFVNEVQFPYFCLKHRVV